MATRIYMESTTAAPAISPTTPDWDTNAQLTRVIGSTTKTGSAMATVETTSDGTAAYDSVHRQIIFGPLAAQTITGTFIGQCRGLEQGTGLNARHRVVIRVIGADLTVRGTAGTITGPEFDATTLTNSPLAAIPPTTLTDTDAQAGDYLVIEVGPRYTTALAQYARQRFGSAGGTDLPEDSSTTTDNNPWIQFSMDIALQGGGGASLLTTMMTRDN
jgi:hypothetical protein